jgi:hypothetical protein
MNGTAPALLKAPGPKPPTAKASATVASPPPAPGGTRVDIPTPPSQQQVRGPARGASKVPAPVQPQQPQTADQPAVQQPPESRRDTGPRRGRLLSILGGVFLVVCCLIWAAGTVIANLIHGGTEAVSNQAMITELLVGAGLALIAAIVPFWFCRLLGRMLLGWRQRRGALPSHLIAAGFSVLSGITFISLTPPPNLTLPFL